MRGACGHECVHAVERALAGEVCFDGREDFSGLSHATGAELAAGHVAVVRTDERDAVGFQLRDVSLRGRVQPHAHVHRGREQHRLVGSKQRG